MKLYVAGPMTGHTDLNFPSFMYAANKLREHGYEVVNPAELNPDKSKSWVDCMRVDIAALVTCDGIALLPGFERSDGAMLEVQIAMALKMPRRRVQCWLAELAPAPT